MHDATLRLMSLRENPRRWGVYIFEVNKNGPNGETFSIQSTITKRVLLELCGENEISI